MKTKFVLIAAVLCGIYSCSEENKETSENEGSIEVPKEAGNKVDLFLDGEFESAITGNIRVVDSCFTEGKDALVKLINNWDAFDIKLTEYTDVNEFLNERKNSYDIITNDDIVISDEMKGFSYQVGSSNWCWFAILNGTGQVCSVDMQETTMEKYLSELKAITKDGEPDFPFTGLSFKGDLEKFEARCADHEGVICYNNSEDYIGYEKSFSPFSDYSMITYAEEWSYEIIDTFSFNNGAKGIRFKDDGITAFEASFDNGNDNISFYDNSMDEFTISDESYEDLKFFFSNLK